jgi:hypothetical protein
MPRAVPALEYQTRKHNGHKCKIFAHFALLFSWHNASHAILDDTPAVENNKSSHLQKSHTANRSEHPNLSLSL